MGAMDASIQSSDEMIVWFREQPASVRIRVISQLLYSCQPPELRFAATVLEDLARRDAVQLREFEVMNNDPSFWLNRTLMDKYDRSMCPVGLALLKSTDHQTALALYSVLAEFDARDQLVNGGGSGADVERLMEDLQLIYTMVLFHPAFSCAQKVRVSQQLNQLRQYQQQTHVGQQHEQQQSESPPTTTTATGADMCSSQSLSTLPSEHFVTMAAVDMPHSSQEQFVHNDTVSIKVSWSDGYECVVLKTPVQFRKFNRELIEQFPGEAGAYGHSRSIPRLIYDERAPRNERIQEIQQYLTSVVKFGEQNRQMYARRAVVAFFGRPDVVDELDSQDGRQASSVADSIDSRGHVIGLDQRSLSSSGKMMMSSNEQLNAQYAPARDADTPDTASSVQPVMYNSRVYADQSGGQPPGPLYINTDGVLQFDPHNTAGMVPQPQPQPPQPQQQSNSWVGGSSSRAGSAGGYDRQFPPLTHSTGRGAGQPEPQQHPTTRNELANGSSEGGSSSSTPGTQQQPPHAEPLPQPAHATMTTTRKSLTPTASGGHPSAGAAGAGSHVGQMLPKMFHGRSYNNLHGLVALDPSSSKNNSTGTLKALSVVDVEQQQRLGHHQPMHYSHQQQQPATAPPFPYSSPHPSSRFAMSTSASVASAAAAAQQQQSIAAQQQQTQQAALPPPCSTAECGLCSKCRAMAGQQQQQQHAFVTNVPPPTAYPAYYDPHTGNMHMFEYALQHYIQLQQQQQQSAAAMSDFGQPPSVHNQLAQRFAVAAAAAQQQQQQQQQQAQMSRSVSDQSQSAAKTSVAAGGGGQPSCYNCGHNDHDSSQCAYPLLTDIQSKGAFRMNLSPDELHSAMLVRQQQPQQRVSPPVMHDEK